MWNAFAAIELVEPFLQPPAQSYQHGIKVESSGSSRRSLGFPSQSWEIMWGCYFLSPVLKANDERSPRAAPGEAEPVQSSNGGAIVNFVNYNVISGSGRIGTLIFQFAQRRDASTYRKLSSSVHSVIWSKQPAWAEIRTPDP